MPDVLNVWFNRTFATNYWILEDFKTRKTTGKDFVLHVTHKDPTSPVLQAGDVNSLEPGEEITVDEYVEWCLRYCKHNKIDVFFPTHFQEHIMKQSERFEALGVKLASPGYEHISKFVDKAETYRFVEQVGINTPPVWFEATTSEELISAYREVSAVSPDKVVVKPTRGVGANGFTVVVQKPLTAYQILTPKPPTVTFDSLLTGYLLNEKQNEPVEPLIVMPWLDNPEISVDCLSDADGNLITMVPRVKLGGRLTALDDTYVEVLEQSRKLLESCPVPYVCNVQWRWFDKKPVLLEVNTRPAGGLYNVLKVTGRSLVWEAFNIALGEPVAPFEPIPHQEYVALDGSLIVPKLSS